MSTDQQKDERPSANNEAESMTHTGAMALVKKELTDIIKSDPLLCDLPPEITLDEINSQVALEYGQAMVVNVIRADNQVMGVVVTQNATVLDLKHAIKRHFLLHQSRIGGTTVLSWRYIWKRHWLYYDGQRLSENNDKLKEYGIRNKDEVTFVKRLRER
ncbi:U11/U12 small nuclear ribonucleoprotein 25 kDa protein-like isoform X2 [Mya arenaria]|nr:U11/U12 small nuclear ribonucleoprotein 25 kDa protein-like isoform X2 [Mya arenaria]XP_052762424.1 U11/U12 small nuclear ribonucleoprotein 25 kDa protein-like isoform X2 [Mya arenaria]